MRFFVFLHSLLSLPLKQKDLTNDNTLVPSLHFESIWVRRKKKESEFTAINLLQSKLAYIAARPPKEWHIHQQNVRMFCTRLLAAKQ